MPIHRLTYLSIALVFFLPSFPLCIAIAQEYSPLKIGASLALSGKLAPSGEQQLQGLTLAIEEANQSTPQLLELISEDNLGEPAKAVSGVQKLLRIDGVNILFSAYSHIVSAITQVVKQAGVPLLYSTAGTSKPLDEYSLAFKDWSDAHEQGMALAEGVRNSGHTSAAYLGEQNEACEEINQGFHERAKSVGITVLASEIFLPGEDNFRSSLLKLSAKNPQAIVLCDFRDAGVIMMQYNALSLMKIPTFHVFAPFLPASDTPEIRALFEENQAQSVWVDFVEGSLQPEQESFIERFTKRFGTPPRLEAAFAYDAGMALKEAASMCRSIMHRSRCIGSALKNVRIDGAAGSLFFGQRRKSTRQSVMIRVRNGVWEKVPLLDVPPTH